MASIDVALDANLVTARGFFGGHLLVEHKGGDTFLIENIGNGLARISATDFEINDPRRNLPQWRSMESRCSTSTNVNGRGQHDQVQGTHVHSASLIVHAPTNYRWSSASDEPQIEARLKVVYSDSFPGPLEAFSAPFGRVHLDPPNRLISPNVSPI